MTAEGDNSVLMQKTCKEQLGRFKATKLNKPKALDFDNLDHLVYVLESRYNKQFSDLMMLMGKATMATKLDKKVPGFLKGLVGETLQV